ncbi:MULTISPECIES: SDR family oxidoreductase [Nocardiaceae]|uniref:SDR family oxidoreductase n=1 Tax=Nocardiaceae TaxID=85025 RepID=UPI0011405C52|nr:MULTISPECIES: SDR family oxidoreductase [Rhodococcus]
MEALTTTDDAKTRMFDSQPFSADLLAGSTAIVTGGGSGLGRGIAIGLAACGASVAVTGRRREKLDSVVQEIEAAGGTASAATCDVRDPVAVEAMMTTVEDAIGPADLLVNNAGATFTLPTLDMSPNAFRAVVETDAFGTFYLCREFGRRRVASKAGGAILNITSTSPYTGNPGRVHGGVGKAGVDSLTKSLAVEWGPYGIRVNALAPGYTPTRGVDAATGVSPDEDEHDAHLAGIAAGVPLQRVGVVEDILWPAVFLMSSAARFVNGATLVVDGGKWLSSGRSAAAGQPN